MIECGVALQGHEDDDRVGRLCVPNILLVFFFFFALKSAGDKSAPHLRESLDRRVFVLGAGAAPQHPRP